MNAAENGIIVVVQRGLALLLDLLGVLGHVLVGDHLGDVLLERGVTLPLLESLNLLVSFCFIKLKVLNYLN